jgi:hypothetical protein
VQTRDFLVEVDGEEAPDAEAHYSDYKVAWLTAFTIRACTTILRGRVASQPGEIGFGPKAVGSGIQIYIPNPSVAIPIR